MLDSTDPQRPRARALSAALARIVRARAVNPRFIAGQMRHGPRGAAELAETVDKLVAFAETTDAVAGELFDLLHDAYVADAACAISCCAKIRKPPRRSPNGSTPRGATASGIRAATTSMPDSVPIVCNPLAGLDPAELIDASPVAADLRKALARSPLASRLSPKVSIAIDCGGAYRLDVPADIRLRALSNGRSLGIEVAGHELGAAVIADVVVVVMRLLEVLAHHGRQARARDVVPADGITAFRAAIADLPIPVWHHESGEPALNPSLRGSERSLIGACRLRDGSFACGIALPFGHADTDSLLRLTAAARTSGAHGFRTAPGRAMLAIGVTEEQLESFVATAKDFGFIVDAADPRRHVVACAGAPSCASAHIAARAMAPAIATAAAPYLKGAFRIHISGCAKGCAHPAPAALTIVGTGAGCALVANGSARDTPLMSVAVTELTGKISGLIRDLKSGAGHG
jgi:precorrin-3B synthase